MTSLLGEAMVGIGADTSKFQSETQSGVTKALNKSQGTFSKVGHSVGGAVGKGIKVGALAIMGGAGALLGTALVKGFSRLNAIDQATAKLEGLGHSAKSVSKIMANSLASVKGTAFGLDEAATTAAGVVAAGIKPGKQLQNVLKTVADTATIAGKSMADTGAIFGSVAARGKLQGDDLMQLQSAGVPVLAMLAKHYKTTAAAASTMVSKGQVDFKNFAAAMHENIGGAALSSGKTFSGAMANFKASLGRIGAGLLGGIFKHLAPAISGITKAMGPLETQAGKLGNKIGAVLGPQLMKLGPWLEKAVKWLTNLNFNKVSNGAQGFSKAFKGINWGSIGDGLKTIGSAIAKLAPGVAKAGIVGIGDALKVFGVFAKFAADHVDLLVKVMPLLVTSFIAYKTAQMAANVVGKGSIPHLLIMSSTNLILAKSNRTLASALQQSTFAQTEQTAAVQLGYTARLRQTAATIASTVAQKAAAAAAKAMAAAQWLLNAAMSANPIVLVVAALVALGAAFVVLYTKSETFRNIVNGAFNAVMSAAGAVINFFTGTVVPGFVAAFNAVSSAVSTVVSFIGSHWKMLIAIFTGPLGIIVGLVVANFGKIRAVVGAVINGVRAVISTVLKVIGGIIGGEVRGWVKIFTGAFAAVRGAMSAAWAGIKAVVSAGVHGVGAIIRGLRGIIMGPINAIGSAMFNAGKKIIGGLINGVKSMVGKVKGAVGSVLGAARKLLPFSPAKEGPFSGKGWTLYSGRSIMDAFAQGIRERGGKVSDAVKHVLEKAKTITGANSALGKLAGGSGKAAQAMLTRLTDVSKLSKDLSAQLAKVGPVFKKSFDNQFAAFLDKGDFSKNSVAAFKKHIADLQGKLKKVVDELAAKSDFKKSIKDALGGEFNLGDMFLSSDDGGSGGAMDIGSITAGVSAVAARLKAFAAKLTALAKAGIPRALISEVANMGSVKGLAMADSLLSSSKKQRNELAAAYASLSQYSNAAGAAAATAVYGSDKQIKSVLKPTPKDGKGSPGVDKRIMDLYNQLVKSGAFSNATLTKILKALEENPDKVGNAVGNKVNGAAANGVRKGRTR